MTEKELKSASEHRENMETFKDVFFAIIKDFFIKGKRVCTGKSPESRLASQKEGDTKGWVFKKRG